MGERKGGGWEGEMGGDEGRRQEVENIFALLAPECKAGVTCTAICDSGAQNHKTPSPESHTLSVSPESQMAVHVIVP